MARASGPGVKTFEAPYHGVYRSMPPHAVPPTAVSQANNVMFALGNLRARPGFVKLSESTPANDPAFGEDPVGIGWTHTSNAVLDLFVMTQTKIWRLRALTGAWTDVSGSLVFNTSLIHVRPRFASLLHAPTGAISTVVVSGNTVDDMVVSHDGGNFFVPIVPGFRGVDLDTVGSRIMRVVPPHRVDWSDVFDATVWSALNFYNATDTPGVVMAVRALGALGAVIYKQDSIYAAYSQPGTPARAFRFELRAIVPGPASAGAVVNTEVGHFYMTARGRIGMFDGTRFQWVGDGAWPYFIDDMDSTKFWQVIGFYDASRGLVVFMYPRVGDASVAPRGVAIVSLPRPEWGVQSYGVWPGVLAFPISAATNVHLFTGGVGVVTRADTGMVNLWDHGAQLDQGTAYPCSFTTGLQAVPGIRKVDIEAFLERGAGRGAVNLSPVTSYNLHETYGSVGASQVVDLTNTSLVHDPKGFNVSGRFVGLNLAWNSDEALVNYRGAAVYGYPVEGGRQ